MGSVNLNKKYFHVIAACPQSFWEKKDSRQAGMTKSGVLERDVLADLDKS